MKPKLFFLGTFIVVLPLFVLLLLPPVAHAATLCTSTQSGDWNAPSSWDCGKVPDSTDDVVITATHTITLTPGATVKTIALGPGGTLNSQSNSLTIADSGSFTNTGGTFNAGTGTIGFAGAGTVSGTVAFNNVTLAGGVDFSSGATVNGTLQIDTGGTVITNAPAYGTTSTLLYNTGSTFPAADEWTPGAVSGQGVPQNVQLSNNTTLNLGSSNRTALNALTIDSGSTLSSTSGILNIKGNWADNGTVSHNNGIVMLNGSIAQSISGSSSFYQLIIDNSSTGGVTLNGDITVGNKFTISAGRKFNGGTGNYRLTIADGGEFFADTGGVFDGGNSTVFFAKDATVSGTVTFQNVTLDDGAVNFGGNSTINGTLRINSNGSVAINAVSYGNASTLRYSTGGTLSPNIEWTANATSGKGVPGNVRLSNNTTLNLGSNNWTARGGLTTDAGSTLNSTTANLNVGGSWINDGAFSHNNGVVIFNGTGSQPISRTTTFYQLTVDNSTGVTLQSNIAVSSTLTINTGKTLNGGNNTLTMANGTAFIVNGTFNADNGTVFFVGTSTVTGMVTFNNVTVAGVVNLGTNPAINGVLQFNSGGAITPVPAYGSSAALRYNTGGTITPAVEWTSGVTAGNGVPVNVEVSTATTLDLGSFDWTALGSITINSGSVLSATTSALNVGGSWINNGAVSHNNGTVVFKGSGGQAIGGSTATTFYNLAVNNSAPVPNDGADVDPTLAITVANLLTVNDGQFQPHTGTVLNQVSINSNGILKPESGAGIYVSGNWINNDTFTHNNSTIYFNGTTTISGSTITTFYHITISNTLTAHSVTMNIAGDLVNNGTFNHNNGTVTFSGAAAQAVSGAIAFYNLTIANIAPSPGDSVDVDTTTAVTVQNNLTVNDGQFQPYSNSTFNHVTINSNGILNPDGSGGGAGVIFASGNWTNNGTFIHHNGTIFLNGTTTISDTVNTIFYDLTILSGANAAANTAITVESNLRVINGQIQPATGSLFKHVAIFSTGTLKPKNQATISINGNWTNVGVFNHANSTLVFNGSSGSQSISGQVTTFSYLTVNNAAGLTLGAGAAVTSTLALSQGLVNNASANIALDDNAIIFRESGSLSNAPDFGATVNVEYIGPTGVSSGPELPAVAATLNNLTLSNSGGVTLTANVTVNGVLTLNVGAFAIDTNTLIINNGTSVVAGYITSATAGTVIYNQQGDDQTVLSGSYGHLTFNNYKKILPSGGVVAIAGTFTPGSAGGHTIAGSTIEYNGAVPQTLPAGFNPYYNLTLNNPAGVTGFAGVTVNNLLWIKNGVFTSGSSYNNIQIDTEATLAAAVDSTIYVSGNLTNNGTFIPNNGTVVFNGNSMISGSKPISFNNVTINNAAQLTGHNLTMYIAGNFANSGTYNHNNGTVTFNSAVVLSLTGTGFANQSLTANTATTFYNLNVSGGTTLLETVVADNATVAGTLTNNGVIRKAKAIAAVGVETFGLTGVTITTTQQGTLSNIQVDRVGQHHANASSAIQTGQYWTLTPTGSNYQTDLTLHHTITDETDATVCHYSGSGSNWDCAHSTASNTTVTRSGVTQLLSDWAVGNFALADLELMKKVNNTDETMTSIGKVVTYTISLINHDPSTVTGVKVSDVLPASLTFNAAAATHGSYSEGSGEWNLVDPIPGGGTAVLIITATVNVTITLPVTNTAEIIAADQIDANTGNNIDTALLIGETSMYLPVIFKN